MKSPHIGKINATHVTVVLGNNLWTFDCHNTSLSSPFALVHRGGRCIVRDAVFVTGAEMKNSHRAMGDVKALYTVFRSPQFWDRRIESLNAFPPIPAVDVSTESDSDESDSDTDSVEGRERVLVEQDIDESDPKNEDVDEVLGDYWQDGEFIPSEVPEEMFQKFTERFSSPRRPGERRTGLQVSEGMANSPIKAWRLIFTTAILERIVKHTNK
ncbi:hypothetical protein IV203_003166 [Nitzschia inconspicua]|uniref:Uncharacterized protein n=1 Tax=Nitzschia inconspicua TaxID=303405 RepID=A0A9K3L315_9STRA|nr:hypothetical protein IV203_003166 [Nitzschia inconspicua]